MAIMENFEEENEVQSVCLQIFSALQLRGNAYLD
jgi:hypothetical protein